MREPFLGQSLWYVIGDSLRDSPERTVFILGAGASLPYGYPLGSHLKETIISEILKGGKLHKELQIESSNNRYFVDFATALRNSACPSIDMFLEQCKAEPQLRETGKEIIASVLLRGETDQNLFPQEDNWLEYLYNFYFNTFDKIASTSVSFITFNYDRSLEHFLWLATKSRYRRNGVETKAVLKNIQIIHPYGKIGHLEWEDHKEGVCRPYRNERGSSFEQCQNMIKIIDEGHENSDEFECAKAMLATAGKVYVLGFGFHRENVKRLGLGNIPISVPIASTQGTLVANELRRIKEMVGRNIDFGESKSLNFLRNIL